MVCRSPVRVVGRGVAAPSCSECPSDRLSVGVPCGKCVPCRLAFGRDWTTRLVVEAASYRPEVCWFVTLTYADAFLPRSAGGRATVRLSEVSAWVRRLRDRGLVFRFFAVSEYGDRFGRPHYHVLVFGLELPDLLPVPDGSGLMWSPLLTATWGRGHVGVGRLSLASVRYVAQYAVKRALPGAVGFSPGDDREIESQVMSRKPGIGLRWARGNASALLSDARVTLPGSSFWNRAPRSMVAAALAERPDLADAFVEARREFGGARCGPHERAADEAARIEADPVGFAAAREAERRRLLSWSVSRGSASV